MLHNKWQSMFRQRIVRTSSTFWPCHQTLQHSGTVAVAVQQSGSSNSNPKSNGWMNHEANSICPSSDDDDDADDLCVANVHRLLVVSRQSGSRILHRRVSHVSGLSGRPESHQRSKSHFSCRRKRRPVSETMFPSFLSSIEWRTVAQSSEDMQTTSSSQLVSQLVTNVRQRQRQLGQKKEHKTKTASIQRISVDKTCRLLLEWRDTFLQNVHGTRIKMGANVTNRFSFDVQLKCCRRISRRFPPLE